LNTLRRGKAFRRSNAISGDVHAHLPLIRTGHRISCICSTAHHHAPSLDFHILLSKQLQRSSASLLTVSFVAVSSVDDGETVQEPPYPMM
jgi:hypothetical protein